MFPLARARRLRRTPELRAMIQDVHVSPNDLILPIFFKASLDRSLAVASMPGHSQLCLGDAGKRAKEIWELGLRSVLLFGVPNKKDPLGSDSYSDHGVIQEALKRMKDAVPELQIMTDVCLCEYTDTGHCGVIPHRPSGKGEAFEVENDPTLELLALQALSHAKAGADVLAPSGMMDGAVLAMREKLDAHNFAHIPILGYSVKYASCLYGPFRHATEGSPSFGDRRTYQMSFANRHEALREADLDVAEGADMLMVKPAHTYLDIIYRIKERFPELPLGAYHPSGEFMMIKSAAANGSFDEKAAVIEVLTAIKRAGADFILTYFAEDFCRYS